MLSLNHVASLEREVKELFQVIEAIGKLEQHSSGQNIRLKAQFNDFEAQDFEIELPMSFYDAKLALMDALSKRREFLEKTVATLTRTLHDDKS